METDKPSRETKSSTSFFQDTQKLTFALGLSSGLAVMSIVGMVLIAVNRGGTSSTTAKATNTNTAAAAQGTGTDTAAPATYDPVAIAKAIGLNESKFQSCLDAKKGEARVNQDIKDGDTAGVNGTPTTFINGTAVSGAVPYSQFKTYIDAALNGTKGSANVPDVTKDDHVLGGKKPKIYLVEYSDFQCPYCKALNPTVKQALDEYGDQIALVYRHYPLEQIHPYARALAEGSECANELGGNEKFWAFHDQIFEG